MNYLTGLSTMPKTWTIILKNDAITERNLKIALDNFTWGTRTSGLHSEIKAGDNVMFLVGVRTQNKQYMKRHLPFIEHRYPMYPDETLTEDFVSDFVFEIDRVILGKITSDFYIDDYKLWPSPDEDDPTKQSVSFKHRFKWVQTHEAGKMNWSINDSNYNFHLSVIAAGKKRAPFPSALLLHNIENIESKLTVSELPSTDEETYQNTVETAQSIILEAGPIKPPQKRGDNGNAKGKWPRSFRIAKSALENANFQCENNPQHITFRSRVTKKNFVEAHHLIPMEKQGEFKVSLDVPENILSLCPNCHSMFHHSDIDITSPLVETFLNRRKKSLKERGVKITLRKLMDYYVKK